VEAEVAVEVETAAEAEGAEAVAEVVEAAAVVGDKKQSHL
jgi:hypothetical protein